MWATYIYTLFLVRAAPGLCVHVDSVSISLNPNSHLFVATSCRYRAEAAAVVSAQRESAHRYRHKSAREQYNMCTRFDTAAGQPANSSANCPRLEANLVFYD